jgi:hypothetical protein
MSYLPITQQQFEDIQSFIQKQVYRFEEKHYNSSEIYILMPKWLLDQFKRYHIKSVSGSNLDKNNSVYFYGARVQLNFKNEVTIFHEDFIFNKEPEQTYTIN